MRPWLVLPLAFILLASSASGYVGPAYASFEDGLGAWSIDHHVWCYDSSEPCEWEWSAQRAPGLAYDGAWSILIRQEGTHDSGTVWVERPMPVPEGERVEVAFWVFSPVVSPMTAWNVRAYVGFEDPESEGDLVHVGHLDDFAGWQRYCLSVPTPDGDTMWVAAGTRVAWETGAERAHWLDYISVRGATGGEPCGLVDDPCHLLGTPCTAIRSACEFSMCPQDRS